MKNIFRRTIQNNRGSLTVDYIFAFILVMGFCLVIMAFSTTLVTVEVVQYAAYAGARRFFAGNMDVNAQQQIGMATISGILKSPAAAALVNNSWFSVGGGQIYVNPGDVTTNPSFSQINPDAQHDTFEGVVIPFTANILNFQIPGFGQTVKTNQSGSNTGFTVNINSFLGREPTFQECRDFWDQRWQQIQKLSSGASATGVMGASSASAVEVIDNGC